MQEHVWSEGVVPGPARPALSMCVHGVDQKRLVAVTREHFCGGIAAAGLSHWCSQAGGWVRRMIRAQAYVMVGEPGQNRHAAVYRILCRELT